MRKSLYLQGFTAHGLLGRGLKYDENILAKAVKIRNKLAHGEYIHIDRKSEEYNLVIELANRCIRKKFFNNVKNCYLEADIVSMYEDNKS